MGRPPPSWCFTWRMVSPTSSRWDKWPCCITWSNPSQNLANLPHNRMAASLHPIGRFSTSSYNHGLTGRLTGPIQHLPVRTSIWYQCIDWRQQYAYPNWPLCASLCQHQAHPSSQKNIHPIAIALHLPWTELDLTRRMNTDRGKKLWWEPWCGGLSAPHPLLSSPSHPF